MSLSPIKDLFSLATCLLRTTWLESLCPSHALLCNNWRQAAKSVWLSTPEASFRVSGLYFLSNFVLSSLLMSRNATCLASILVVWLKLDVVLHLQVHESNCRTLPRMQRLLTAIAFHWNHLLNMSRDAYLLENASIKVLNAKHNLTGKFLIPQSAKKTSLLLFMLE